MNFFANIFDINPSTLSGTIDIVAIRQPDDSVKVSPFHVRFGKLLLLKSNKKLVQILINGQKTDLVMKLGSAGEAFFVERAGFDEKLEKNQESSPIPSDAESEAEEETLPKD